MKSIDLIQIEDSIEAILSQIEQEISTKKILKKELASKAVLSKEFIKETLRRNTSPSLNNILKLLNVLGLTLKVERL